MQKLTLNDSEVACLKMILGHYAIKDGGVTSDLYHDLFKADRSACCGAKVSVGGKGSTHWHRCESCFAATDVAPI